MWSAISRIFSKSPSSTREERSDEAEEMNRRPSDMDEAAVTRQAKPRTTMKWLLSKAFNNKVPDNLKEPFYRDHEGQEHLKPQLAGGLASAELYCLALGNIYSDPAYHSMNHWAIVQALARKGAPPRDPPDAPLTETTLIQTNPLKLNAHMAVVESLMQLYAREVVTSERVAAAVQRWRGRGGDGDGDAPPPGGDPEAGLLAWVAGAAAALRRRADQELREGVAQNGGGGEAPKPPDVGAPRTLRDLCDGAALAALVAHYCPQEVGWGEVRTPRVPTAQDAARNVRLVGDFCARCLPADIFHLEVEDVVYLKDSMKTNLIVFLADLFNLLEINPAKCVTDRFGDDVGFPPRNAHGVVHKRNLLQTVATPIPDLRSGLDDPATPSFQVSSRPTPSHQPLRKASSFQQSQSEFSEDSLRRGSDESFVVHRGRGVPTLRSVLREVEPQPQPSNHEPRREGPPAGKPSNWEDKRGNTFAGRRSRRNSITDDSQLTIENFGGSQENLNFIGRNPDKEVAVHVGRKISAPAFPGEHTPSTPVRSSIQDARGSLRLGYGDDEGEKVDAGSEKRVGMRRQMSSDDITLRRMRQDRDREEEEAEKDRRGGDGGQPKTSFADIGRSGGIQLVYMNDRGDNSPAPAVNGTSERKASFAAPPATNTTTWQQHATNAQQRESGPPPPGGAGDPGGQPVVLSSQLSDIRLKLEEKRRHIESEKRRMEMAMNKQRQKVGKQAFLQAVSKGRGNLLKSPEGDQNTDGQAEGPSTTITTTTTSPEPTPQPPPPNKPQRPFTLQEINDDATMVERKWLDDGQPFIETRRTPDLENMDLETYQQSIAQMNTSLHDIQSDMQRLAQQHNQMQTQNLLAQQQRQIQQLRQQQQHLQSLHHQQQQQQQLVNQQPQYGTYRQTYAPPLQSSASAPHIPQSLYAQSRVPEQPQFFLHDHPQTPPIVPQRRTWAQQPQPPPPVDDYHPPETRTWGKQDSTPNRTGGFLLHDNTDRYRDESRYHDKYSDNKYHNGDQEHGLQHSNSFTLSQQYLQQHPTHGTSHSTPSASPQHRNIHRQISQLLDEGGGRRNAAPVSLLQMEATPSRERKTSVTHAPIPAPPADDMAPQSISFIGNAVGTEADEGLAEGLSRLNITSGSRTYRIPSPTRPLLVKGTFNRSVGSPTPQEQPSGPREISSLDADPSAQKGFYISFDDEAPKRPKPPLRVKRMSPKKERSYIDVNDETDELERMEKQRQLERELDEERQKKGDEERRRALLIQQERERLRERQREASAERQKVAAASAIIIGNELSNPDPDLLDEKERKKERIMMLSLQRRQRQEEAKARKEAEAQMRREREKEKEEEKQRRKEEQAARRTAILEQYKLKKALEEAEREGKTFDRHDLMQSMKPAPKMRTKPGSTSRPRPKTIHIDSGSVQLAEGMSMPSSRGKKGSTSNLTAYGAPSMRRDYYRGSQDSLADRSMSSTMLYRDSPDDSHGMSPCHSANQTLGRRSSYKTSRDPSPAQVRGRPRPQVPFRGRKSSSMMNLYGSSTDQDSLAYRLGDTDSGLGRATPPRRAPSPGMGGRHLPSPSGPGSLPGLMTKGRRVFDDGSSDISSTPSSMMDYTGPRLYKQPATKSNRSIILNAVEYCVFPGVVNREAKRRVLEEINRSEAKHFLILFRDAGCQFRALYSYCPDTEDVTKLYGTGPKHVNDKMFDKFFKYNSGGKCFSQIHTKHLTVTIDAFTIHNSLWQGKKVNLPNKKDMALVI